jgi:myotubularin-related protein 9
VVLEVTLEIQEILEQQELEGLGDVAAAEVEVEAVEPKILQDLVLDLLVYQEMMGQAVLLHLVLVIEDLVEVVDFFGLVEHLSDKQAVLEMEEMQDLQEVLELQEIQDLVLMQEILELQEIQDLVRVQEIQEIQELLEQVEIQVILETLDLLEMQEHQEMLEM